MSGRLPATDAVTTASTYAWLAAPFFSSSTVIQGYFSLMAANAASVASLGSGLPGCRIHERSVTGWRDFVSGWLLPPPAGEPQAASRPALSAAPVTSKPRRVGR